MELTLTFTCKFRSSEEATSFLFAMLASCLMNRVEERVSIKFCLENGKTVVQKRCECWEPPLAKTVWVNVVYQQFRDSFKEFWGQAYNSTKRRNWLNQEKICADRRENYFRFVHGFSVKKFLTDKNIANVPQPLTPRTSHNRTFLVPQFIRSRRRVCIKTKPHS